MLSHNTMKNKIVFAVAIGFLVAVVQSRPYASLEDSSSLEDSLEDIVAVKAVLKAVPVEDIKGVEVPVISVKSIDLVKDEVIAETSKDNESTILSIVPVVAAVKADSVEDDSKSNDDSSSVESGEVKKDNSGESSEEIKPSPEVPVANSESVAVIKPVSVEPTVEAAPEAAATIEKDIIVEPVVAAAEPAVSTISEPAVEAAVEPAVIAAVEARSASEEVVPVAAVVVENVVQPAVESVVVPALKTSEEPALKPVVEDSEVSPSVQVPEVAINTKAIDAEEYVRSAPVEENASPAVEEPKVIIVTPSADVVLPSEAPVVAAIELKAVDVQKYDEKSAAEDVVKAAETSPVEVSIVDDASKKQETPAVSSETSKSVDVAVVGDN